MAPPRKRKADAVAAGGGDGAGAGDAPPTAKKSKAEKEAARARARAGLAKAKAWSDARKKKAPPAAVATPATSAGKKKAPFSAGTASSGASTAASPPARKRRDRKSTGAMVASAGRGVRIKEEGEGTAAKRGRRRASAGAGASSAAASFRFDPPPAKEEDDMEEEEEEEEEDVSEEEEDEQEATKDAAVQSPDRAAKAPSHARAKRALKSSEEEDDDDDVLDAKPSARKRREREEGKARLWALREERERRGLPVAGGARGRSRGAAAHAPSPFSERKSPDPPGAAARAAAAPPAAAGASRTYAAAGGTGARSPDPPAAYAAASSSKPAAAKSPEDAKSAARKTKNVPPPAVAGLFAPPPKKKASKQYDPSRPFPAAPGRRLPPAAYCGCGPTPGSGNAMSVRGNADVLGGDLCNASRPGSFTLGGSPSQGQRDGARASIRDNVREGMKTVVDPPYRRKFSGGAEDERKAPPPRPAPPAGTQGGGGGEASGKGDAAEIAPRVPAPAGEGKADNAGRLLDAMSRAKAMVSSAAASNRRRRENMGIRSDGVVAAPAGAAAAAAVGLPPRDLLRAGARPAGAPTPDPPAVDPMPRMTARRAPRGVEGARKYPQEVEKKEREGGDAAVVTTDAGEDTSEVGARVQQNGGVPDEVAAPKRPFSSWKSTCLSVMKCLMFVQILIGVVYLAMNGTSVDMGDKWMSPSIPVKDAADEKAPCFVEYPVDWNGESSREIDSGDNCEGGYKQCPQWGRCHGGKLVDCDDEDGVYQGLHLYIPNNNEDACVLSSEATELIGFVQGALIDMTVAQTCGYWDRIMDEDSVSQDDSFPLFSVDKVVEKLNRDGNTTRIISSELLLWLSPAFDDELVKIGSLSGGDTDDVDAIGLGTGVTPSTLSLPFGCTMKALMWEVLEMLGRSVLVVATFVVNNIWFLLSNYPIYSMIAFALWKFVGYVQSRRRHRTKVRKLYAVVLDETYDRLAMCEDREGYAQLLLRDDVGKDMYPTSFPDQQFMNIYVWPRITQEIRADNRIRKYRRQANGKDLEHWDMASQSKTSRRNRRKLGTAGSDGNRSDNELKEEQPTPKREP